ncbi:phosphatidate cytidylyltransferase [Alkalinema sp. FACHB-956]|nr:phosphatidate cytidylyltransferase [Alkalinema sp. FACHB-956]
MQWFASIETLGEKVAIAALWLGLVGIAATLVKQFTRADSEIVRKVVHIGTGNIILLAWWMALPTWVILAAAVLFGAIALASFFYPLLPSIDSVGRKSLGTFFYATSIGLLAAWFWPQNLPEFAVLGILIMTWGDGLAGLIGRQFGTHPYKLWGMKKSWEGSLTMALMSAVTTLLVLAAVGTPLSPLLISAVLVAIVATGLEAFSKLGLDNVTVPIGSATVAYAISLILG